MTIYKCKECGSTDIRMLFWCSPNTMATEHFVTDEDNDCYCPDCNRITPSACIHDGGVNY